MAKPLALRIPSDDCEVEIGGETYTPHEGEWVEVVPVLQVADTKAIMLFQRGSVDLAAIEPVADASDAEKAAANLERSELMDRLETAAMGIVRGRVLRWSWTDMSGRCLPQPEDDLAVFSRLTQYELFYLVQLIQSGDPAARKNGSRPSVSTSSATSRRRTRT